MSDRKVIQLEDRIPKLREQRKQKTNRRFVFYITLFFILLLIVTYIESPLSNVKTINVSGNRYFSAAQIKAASGLTAKSKIWGVNQKTILAHLNSLPSIKSVTVKTHFLSGRVDLNVMEYKRVAYLKTENSYKPVLANGQFMSGKLSNVIPVHAPILIGFKEGKVMSSLTEQLSKMNATTLYNISEIDFTPSALYPKGITLYLNDGHQALANIPTLAAKMKLYPSILANLPDNQKGVVQLRVGAYWSPSTAAKQANGGETNGE
ncbi:FtsQ-type POTRA domain-containing protein [Pullulanibacillus sp. KACC 23026]|uniref:cell division protein FtsQ/DivIB n=1 Tax=Pullulanibacillus sp. KACC 23026 TaxID=3028315 RepID=UPI0023AF62D7|nr:FtsQ-type POTRA domain-containing protein [Pullulanibacillus sp. KACC 23026]WEG11662.1 FtsQ-type POTRA domain-containing protein [Pullulanibacillus sp. KACC 23026]